MAICQQTHEHIVKVLDSDMGPLQKWVALRDFLTLKGLAYKSIVKATAFIVHPKNRSGTLINPHSCHRKGSQILKAGADMSMLSNSVCMELSPDNAVRRSQLEPFEKLVASSPMLSPLLGCERYATLSSGHTCQFVKALIHGSETCEPSLAGPNGRLGPHVWQSDKDLQSMVEQGWEWLILPHSLEQHYPRLPELIQHALNCPNSVYGIQSEIELAAAIWESVSATPSQQVDWDEVSEQACSGGLIQPYAKSIGKFVKLYSGTLVRILI